MPMSDKVFCFASAKGGSGKTIISACLATALAHLGKKTLLIDADGSTNGMTLLYLESVVEIRNGKPLANLSGIFDRGDAKSPVELAPDLWLLPATFVMSETHEVSADGFSHSLRAAISGHQEGFDCILIDAQAGIEDFALAAIEHSDQTIIVSEYDPISKKGIDRFRKMIVSNQSPLLLFNKVLPEFVPSIGDPLGVSDLLPPIPWNAEVVRNYVKGKLALDMDEGNVFTIGLLRTAGALFGREVQDLVEKWRNEKNQFIRAPLRKQLDEVSDELEYVQKEKVSAEFEASTGARVSLYYWLFAAVVAVAIAFSFTYSLLIESNLSGQAAQLSTAIDRLDTDIQAVEDSIKKWEATPNDDGQTNQLRKSLEMEKEMLSESRDRFFDIRDSLDQQVRQNVMMRMYMVGITIGILACFLAYYVWRARPGEQRKLALLQKAAILSNRVEELRAMKSQLTAYEQSSLEELIK